MAAYAGQGGGLLDSFVNLVTGAGGGSANPYAVPLQPGGGGGANPNTQAILSQLGFQNPNAGALGQTAQAGLPGFPPALGQQALQAMTTWGSGKPGTDGAPTGHGGVTDVWGNPATQDGPSAWFAKAALNAYNSHNTAGLQHLLNAVTGPNGPQGSLLNHYLNFIKGLMAGDPTRIQEAQYYATNPSYNGWNNAAGDGIPGDGM